MLRKMTNANSKDETKFSGKPDKGFTFEEFDKKALSWARKTMVTPMLNNSGKTHCQTSIV
jgi:hypothetical protein